jgi:hypothetical protein
MPGEVARVRPVAHPDRNGGGGLSLRTLAIASAGSLSAALVTSRLFPPGTIYASALTPVIVAAVSEMLNRPANRVAELRRQRRTMVMEAARAPYGEEGAALQGAPGFAQGAAAEEELATTAHGNGTGDSPPIRIHGRSSRSRLLHPKVWIITGAVAFTIAAGVLTLPELIFGGAVATKHRTTFFGGGRSSPSTKTQTTTTPKTGTQTQTQTTVTETVPAPSQTDTQTTTTQTQTTTTDTGTQTTPTQTTTTPTDTGTSTTPGGAAVPPTP